MYLIEELISLIMDYSIPIMQCFTKNIYSVQLVIFCYFDYSQGDNRIIFIKSRTNVYAKNVL